MPHPPFRPHPARPSTRRPRLRPARTAGLAFATLLTAAVVVSPARAEYPLVGVLTGGELRSTGSGTIRADEVASDFVYDPATADNCIGPMCNDRRDLTFHQKGTLRWDTTWLLDARYPGAPTDPEASPNAVKWREDVGSWTVQRVEEDYQFPDDQGDGGHESNPVTERVDCASALTARMPEGAETPLVSTAGADEDGNGFFDASTSRSLYLNAFGSTFSGGTCGENDRYGYYGPFGFAPVDAESVTWDLGTEPRETFRWERAGRMVKTEACDPKWTDGTPRDTETQCAESSDFTVANTLSCALCVTDLRYEQHPGGRSGWQEVPTEGTWDGNEVRITAVIENRSTRTLTVPLLLRDKRSGRKLEGPGLENPKTYTFPASGTTTLEVVWETDGFAWEGQKPASERDIQVLTPYGGAQQRIIVQPRPVVLVHGWKSSAAGWDGYAGMMQGIHPLWRGYAVGDGQFAGTMNTSPFSGNDITINAAAEHQYVQNLRDRLSADHVDLVAHSMGGLISRQYIHSFMPIAVDGRPVARRLVMLGTPNQGSPCADLIRAVARGIPTHQLTPGFAAGFNRTVTNRKGVPFSIAAGDINERTCNSEVKGDGVVEVPSALWTVGDRIITYVIHTSMTGDQHLLDSFVKPRLALDPTAAKAFVGATRARRAARGADRTSGPTAARAATAGAGDLRATGAAARAKRATSQVIGTTDATVRGTKAIRASFGPGATAAFAFLAEAGIAAELVDPTGKVAATQQAGSPAAQAPVRWLSAEKARAGQWTLRLKGNGPVASAAVAAGSRQTLAVTVKATKKGARTISAKVKGLRTGRGTSVVARIQPATGKPIAIVLRSRGGAFRGTLKKVPEGATSVVVTATVGKVRLLSAADLQ